MFKTVALITSRFISQSYNIILAWLDLKYSYIKSAMHIILRIVILVIYTSFNMQTSNSKKILYLGIIIYFLNISYIYYNVLLALSYLYSYYKYKYISNKLLEVLQNYYFINNNYTQLGYFIIDNYNIDNSILEIIS